MRWIVPIVCCAAACGGPDVPVHSGYKSAKAKPWKKPKALAFDDKLEAKAEGELDYGDYRRARWYALDLPSHGELSLRLEITPPGDAVNEDFDLGVEVLDPGFRVISKSDLEDEDAGELTKSKTLFDLVPGKYMIHVYLQGRMDTADYVLRATFKATASADVKTNFPADVEFLPSLAMVPLDDDTPKSYRPPTTVVTKVTRRPRKDPKVEKPDAPATISARIIGLKVAGGNVEITLGRGTASTPPATDGMKAKVAGIAGVVSIGSCSERTCKAVVQGTPDQITKAGSSVVLSP
jgi:hypothetical protein